MLDGKTFYKINQGKNKSEFAILNRMDKKDLEKVILQIWNRDSCLLKSYKDVDEISIY